MMRPHHKLGAMARKVGCSLTTLGDVEQLAGINIKSNAERRELWAQFRHLYQAPTQQLVDAVMDHCAAIAIRRIKAGKLCLVRTTFLCSTSK